MAKDKKIKTKEEGSRFIRSKADFDVMAKDRSKAINRYYTKAAPMLAAEAYRGNAEYILGAAKAFHTMLERIGDTPQARARKLNETHRFYVESIRREIEWLARFTEANAVEDYQYLDESRLKKLGRVARPCLEGERFLDDHANNALSGTYGCHDLSVLKELSSPFRFGCFEGVPLYPGAEKAKELLSEMPSGMLSSPESAEFIRKKVELEKLAAELLLTHFADKRF